MSTAPSHPVPVRAEFTVTGMTCAHCVASVTEEVGALPGVESVDVDLATGALAVTSAGPLAPAAVAAAVEEAGYTATPAAQAGTTEPPAACCGGACH
ncbi:cation transporter [Streptomyces sp. DSM 44917]|uniref:Cation transporter n=1 Tax=Streptomyces boetiae TaxID=3075541 RepID=A0ABU2LE77_9ACTN|nr:cation transporter [Streptomyces sp. DSM 44917]MDT0309876.1 cation transporter [Streptomyces sp. DSM 44917]